MPKINKENIIKLESLEINTKYALGTMDIKNQKRKIKVLVEGEMKTKVVSVTITKI